MLFLQGRRSIKHDIAKMALLCGFFGSLFLRNRGIGGEVLVQVGDNVALGLDI